MARVLLLLFCIFIIEKAVTGLRVSVFSDGPAVRGSNITFTATVDGYSGENLKYVYFDDAQPEHRAEFILSSNTSQWVVEYLRDIYESGDYTVTVNLMKSFYGIWYREDTSRTNFELTDSLNGNLVLNQNNIDRPNKFVAVNKTVQHYIHLPGNELLFLKKNASSVITYWFIDCMYIDQTTDFALNYTYQDVMGDHYIDALVVANNKPLPPITTTTTTTTTTTPSTTILPTTPNNVNETHQISKRALSNKTKKSPMKDFICHNSSIVPIGDTYTYGHYQQIISVRETISTINITGMNWLQHGDLLNLQVKYSGTPPFDYCAMYKIGQYNVTGNETCVLKTRILSNLFPLIHYFSDSNQHTVVVVVENEIGKAVSRATINIYKAPIHAQLSVIVVPVVFCLLAVILVVFGIAFYQHRSRYTIEVADFDFGQQVNLDYKTFSERLRDSFRNALNFRQQDDTEPLASDTRYNSMT